MKKLAKIIVIFSLVCACFWVCSCNNSNGSSSSENNVENSSNLSEEDAFTENGGEDSASEDGMNGGNWTGEMPLN